MVCKVNRILLVLIVVLLALYVAASTAISVVYARAYSTNTAWDVAERRNGLLIVYMDDGALHALSPLSNCGDDWMF